MLIQQKWYKFLGDEAVNASSYSKDVLSSSHLKAQCKHKMKPRLYMHLLFHMQMGSLGK